MNKQELTVIDYGMGNLLSVKRALEHCGASVIVSSDPAQILSVPRLVLPGVGAFGDAMAELARRELSLVIKEAASRGTLIMGICLGMQMLLDESEEFGQTAGLGLIPGKVVPISTLSSDGNRQKVPHIGWNDLVLPAAKSNWDGTLLQGISPGDAFYFVHSFMASPLHQEHRLADCVYGGVKVSAVVAKDNIIGCQFHPEKSGEVGLKILRRFLTL